MAFFMEMESVRISFHVIHLAPWKFSRFPPQSDLFHGLVAHQVNSPKSAAVIALDVHMIIPAPYSHDVPLVKRINRLLRGVHVIAFYIHRIA